MNMIAPTTAATITMMAIPNGFNVCTSFTILLLMYKYVKQSRVGYAENPLQKSLCYHIQPFNKLILRDINTCVNENYFPIRLQTVSSTGFKISPVPTSKPSPGKLDIY
jgi:hypothetical protein